MFSLIYWVGHAKFPLILPSHTGNLIKLDNILHETSSSTIGNSDVSQFIVMDLYGKVAIPLVVG